MFENEYVMTRKRFDKWNTPKFWKDTPGFYVFTFLAFDVILHIIAMKQDK